MMNSQLKPVTIFAKPNAGRVLLPMSLQVSALGKQGSVLKDYEIKKSQYKAWPVKEDGDAMLYALLLAILVHIGLFAKLLPATAQVDVPNSATPMMVSIIQPQVQKAIAVSSPVQKVVKRPKPRVKPVVKKKVITASEVVDSPKAVDVEVAQEVVQAPPAPPAPAMPEMEQVSETVETDTASITAAPAQRNQTEVVEPPKFGVAYLHNPAPSYPRLSHRVGEEGQVILRVLVSASGHAESVSVDKSSQFERLDQAAVAAVKQWRFIPAKKGNEAMSAYVLVPISFSLSD